MRKLKIEIICLEHLNVVNTDMKWRRKYFRWGYVLQ